MKTTLPEPTNNRRRHKTTDIYRAKTCLTPFTENVSTNPEQKENINNQSPRLGTKTTDLLHPI